MERKANPHSKDRGLLSPRDVFFQKFGFWALLALISIITAVVFKDFIFSGKIYLFKDIGSDTINTFFPQYYHIADYLHDEGLPKWSFNQGMGQNIFPGWLQDPFVGFLYIAGKDSIAHGLVYMEIIKIFCAGVFFFLFLKKTSVSDFAALAGSLCYAFSGIVILGGGWFIFSTFAVYAAMLLYSFEKFYRDGDWRLLPLSMALLMASSVFSAWFACLFLAVYIPITYFEESGRSFKGFARLMAKTSGLLLLGTAASAFFFLPALNQMMNSPRFSGEASLIGSLMTTPVFRLESAYSLTTAVLRFFSSDMSGTGSHFGGWRNYLEAPIFYCGLITLLGFPQTFRGLSLRGILMWAALFTVFFLPIFFPFFRYAAWLFTGDYFRQLSCLPVFLLLILSAKTYHRLSAAGRLSLPILGGSLAGLLILLFLPYPERLVNSQVKYAAAAFLALHAAALMLFSIRRFKFTGSILFLALISGEAAYMSHITVGTRPVMTRAELKTKTGYNDDTNDVMDYLRKAGVDFFRIEKDYSSGPADTPSLNDAKVQNFFGTRSYHSFNQLNYIRFLHEMGVIQGDEEVQTRWVQGLWEYPSLHSFASVHFSLHKFPVSSRMNDFYTPFRKIGDVQVLKNKHPLPLGYTYDQWIPLGHFQRLPDSVKVGVLYKAAVIDPSSRGIPADFPRLSGADLKPFHLSEFAEDIAARAGESLKISELSQNRIKGSINVSGEKKLLFFTIPFDEGWTAFLNGQNVKPLMVNMGFLGFFLDRGEHVIELKYSPPLLITGTFISLFAVFLYSLMLIGTAIKHSA